MTKALAQRIRELLAGLLNLSERKMFGGIAFILQGNMACGVHDDDLILRVGLEQYELALVQPFTRPFDLTGRPYEGVDISRSWWVSAGGRPEALDSANRRICTVAACQIALPFRLHRRLPKEYREY